MISLKGFSPNQFGEKLYSYKKWSNGYLTIHLAAEAWWVTEKETAMGAQREREREREREIFVLKIEIP